MSSELTLFNSLNKLIFQSANKLSHCSDQTNTRSIYNVTTGIL